MRVVTAVVVAHIDVGIANVLDAMPITGSEYDYTLQLMDSNPLNEGEIALTCLFRFQRGHGIHYIYLDSVNLGYRADS